MSKCQSLLSETLTWGRVENTERYATEHYRKMSEISFEISDGGQDWKEQKATERHTTLQKWKCQNSLSRILTATRRDETRVCDTRRGVAVTTRHYKKYSMAFRKPIASQPPDSSEHTCFYEFRVSSFSLSYSSPCLCGEVFFPLYSQ